MKKKIAVFGLGKKREYVEECIDNKEVNICCYIDNNKSLWNQFMKGIKIINPKDFQKDSVDYIIVTTIEYLSIKQQLIDLKVPKSKIICFFSAEDMENKYNFIDEEKHKELYQTSIAEIKIIQEKIRNNNMMFEKGIYNKDYWWCPQIVGIEETIKKLLENDYSVSRFGDGEFEMIFGRERPKFQKVNKSLALRLYEVIQSKKKGLLIALADNYSSLDQYTSEAADRIRTYMTEDVRKKHLEVLEQNRVYYNAYLSRPYIIFNDKEKAGYYFKLLKLLWKNKRVLIIEGEETRNGYGNDLFQEAVQVERILCPSENAYDYYDDIYKEAKKYGRNKLVLVSLGPAASVLAYDLHCSGIRTIDIGHLDNEYEWYLKQVQVRVNIANKYVNEVMGGDDVEPVLDENFQKQVIAGIGIKAFS